MRYLLFLCAASTIVVTAEAGAGVVIVDPTGFGDATTIQAGINLASPGDTVLVAATTYSGEGNRELSFGSKNIHMISLGGCGTTIINCQGLGRGMLFDGGQDTTCVIEGISIRNAVGDSGGAVFCRNHSGPKFVACLFAENTATVWGGAMFCFKSSPVLDGCVFESNDAVAGGRADGYGGALACYNASSPRIEGCDFADNTASSVGGALYASGSCEPLLVGCTFTGNRTDANSGGAFFGGPGSNVTFADCTFVGNHGSSGGVFSTQGCDATFTGCSFGGNTAQYVGAVCHCIYPATHSYEDCMFYRNSTGGIAAVLNYWQTGFTMHRCTISGNTAGGGMTVFRLSESSPTITNTIIAFSGGGTLTDCDVAANPTFDKCVIFENEGGNDLCGTVVDTLVIDPRFCAITDDDYSLCQNSPCLDTMNPWGEAVGARDMGCGPCDSPVEARSWGGVKALYR